MSVVENLLKFSFFCLPGWRDFYLITVAGIFVVAALAQLWPRFASYYWLRLSLFCAWAAYGVVPTAHFVVLNGGLGRLVHARSCHKSLAFSFCL